MLLSNIPDLLDRQRLRVYSAICVFDYTAPLRFARQQRCDGSGDWFIMRPETCKWLSPDADSQCLWLRGSSGHGKSTLAGRLTDHLFGLQKKPGNSPDSLDPLVLYYFFTSRWQESLNPKTFLRSLLQQILHPRTLSPSLLHKLSEMFLNPRDPRDPDFSDLEDLVLEELQKVAVTRAQTFIVIDGVNETHRSDQEMVMKYLMRLFENFKGSLRLFTSADIEIDLSSPFRQNSAVTTLYLQPRDSQGDIDLYLVTDGAATLKARMPDSSEELRSHIIQTLSSKAGGM